MSASGISFYGDESGSHGEGTFVLSGYLGTDEDWSDFEAQWHAVLQDGSIGGRSIDYFHMRECFKLEGEFANLSLWQANRKLYALVDVLCPFLRSKRLREFTSIIERDVYNRAVQGPIKETFHNPYLFTFGTLMIETAGCVKDELDQQDQIYFFMDDQIPLIEKSVAGAFSRAKLAMMGGLERLFDAITFRSDKSCYPLQAADLIAWQRHRKELDLPEDHGGRREWKRLHNATPKDQHVLFPYREDGLVEFSKRVETQLKERGLR